MHYELDNDYRDLETNMSSISLLVAFLACSICFPVTSQQDIVVKHWIEQDDNNGPVVNLFCGQSILCTPCTYRWIFDNKTIAENGVIRTNDPSHFDVTLYMNLTHPLPECGFGSLLLITNVQRDDLGIYECEVDIYGTVVSNGTTLLNIEDHLLPAYTTESQGLSSTILPTKVFQTTSTTHTEDSKISNVTFSIIGGSICGGLLILATVIICFIIKAKTSKSKGGLPTTTPYTVSRNLEDGLLPDQDVLTHPTHGQSSRGHIPHKVPSKLVSIPEVDETDINEEDITKPNSPETSDFPIYSQVNKAAKTDESKGNSVDSENSGMVENKIYVSAGSK